MTTAGRRERRLSECAPELNFLLTRGAQEPSKSSVSEIKARTVSVAMRDGVRLATDIYFPTHLPAPAIAMRTPYGRSSKKLLSVFVEFASRGYIVISQDCRGTGDSEPDIWDYYVYEAEDGYDFVEWITAQDWFDGFLGACGGSYAGQTQWGMATHPAMTTIAPEVSGLGVAVNTVHLHMFVNAYAHAVGKGRTKVAIDLGELERVMLSATLAGGLFNEPLHTLVPDALLSRYPSMRGISATRANRLLWERYCLLSARERAAFVKLIFNVDQVTMTEVEALSAIFGQAVSHDAHTIPKTSSDELMRCIHAVPLMITGWYDWALNDALATWVLFHKAARDPLRPRTRLIITPGAHNTAGYHEGQAEHPELGRAFRLENNIPLLLQWFGTLRTGNLAEWPTVIYYLMGVNEWRCSTDWPPKETHEMALYVSSDGTLTATQPQIVEAFSRYTYDPVDPTPTVGGSVLSSVYPAGSVDLSSVHRREDILTFSTEPLEHDLDVVGPMRLILYASSSATDTDFAARLSDVFPDGRAIQLQSGILRARYRNAEPELLEPGRIYRFEIDMWATANRFMCGHRLRLDISSADFPRFDRNSNRGGDLGPPLPAMQTVFHDARHPSCLVLSVLGEPSWRLSA